MNNNVHYWHKFFIRYCGAVYDITGRKFPNSVQINLLLKGNDKNGRLLHE
ncbi:hypothetical protein [Methanoplanus limicola]|uniref:Uncharacterized protein n=1 Tax=Methanoplanus limicola DSM 2279 TaxID=937775 RepID=H1Z0A1_9EURY|nr:hypothetical protein [Methanoplanus limicola]EHQ36193.1 hypothetical protein Metlim_2111 [Methanoplanus limicola DSM 2279]